MAASSGKTHDVLIVGGGVIGLSLAWELAQHGAQVCVLDRGPLGKEASWAGAGMIPPGPPQSHWSRATPQEQLSGLSEQLHPLWHERLLEKTGIESEYQRCGGIQLALSSEDAQLLDNQVARWKHLAIPCHALDANALCELEPTLASQAAKFARSYHLPDEAQIRNPRHLRALVAACRAEGVTLLPGVEVLSFLQDKERLQAVQTSEGRLTSEQFCVAAGSWSGDLAISLGVNLPIRPLRGQIVLLRGTPGLLRRNINLGKRYLVPRQDGRLLIGSTQEDVGFAKENTSTALAELMDFASSINPELSDLPIEHRWSGLRPATADGLPYLGRIPQVRNGWLATGHFRAGLQLSPATAVVMREQMLGQDISIDTSAFAVAR